MSGIVNETGAEAGSTSPWMAGLAGAAGAGAGLDGAMVGGAAVAVGAAGELEVLCCVGVVLADVVAGPHAATPKVRVASRTAAVAEPRGPPRRLQFFIMVKSAAT